MTIVYKNAGYLKKLLIMPVLIAPMEIAAHIIPDIICLDVVMLILRNMMAVDPTKEDIRTLVEIRNMAAEKISIGHFKPGLYLMGQLKKEVENRNLPMSFYENMNYEIFEIVKGITKDPTILVQFEQYLHSVQLRMN